jgi:hypothetical protein
MHLEKMTALGSSFVHIRIVTAQEMHRGTLTQLNARSHQSMMVLVGFLAKSNQNHHAKKMDLLQIKELLITASHHV